MAGCYGRKMDFFFKWALLEGFVRGKYVFVPYCTWISWPGLWAALCRGRSRRWNTRGNDGRSGARCGGGGGDRGSVGVGWILEAELLVLLVGLEWGQWKKEIRDGPLVLILSGWVDGSAIY